MIGLGQNVYIPDTNFKALLISPWIGINTNGDSEIQVSEAISYTFNLNVGMSNISDLTGIEAFVNLTEFSCYGNQLTNIDLTQNTALTYLNCNDNQLTNLDLSQNNNLDILYCENNQLTSLNLNGATSLGAVWANFNQLIYLDLSTNFSLEVLEIGMSQLTSLDLSQNPNLVYLVCWGNQLTNLDLSQNLALMDLYCENNQLNSINLNGAISLWRFTCSDNLLTSLDLSTNVNLMGISCNNNQINSLDLSSMTGDFNYLNCINNDLVSLDLRNGLNAQMYAFHSTGNPNLTCISVDDSVWAYSNWIGSPVQPPPATIDPQQYFSNNCPSATSSLCDSVVIIYNYMDTTTTPNLIYFDVQVSGFGPSVGYPGFVLLNNLGDTIAYENFNTAGNVFTLMPNAIETRFLDIIQNFSLPFNGFIHLVDGWFAGNPNTECIYPFYITGTTSIEEESINKELLKAIDILGRDVEERKNTPLFYIYDDGTIEKKIILE